MHQSKLRYSSSKIKNSHVPYMTKTLRKAIMKRTELETKSLKNMININLKAYKKQSNSCSKLHEKEKITYNKSNNNYEK